jgi:hypothetical protein
MAIARPMPREPPVSSATVIELSFELLNACAE